MTRLLMKLHRGPGTASNTQWEIFRDDDEPLTLPEDPKLQEIFKKAAQGVEREAEMIVLQRQECKVIISMSGGLKAWVRNRLLVALEGVLN